MTLGEGLAILALAVSGGALVVAILAKQQAKKASLVGLRREAIGHIRTAISDVSLHSHITGETVTSIREALDGSHLVFSCSVCEMIGRAFGIAFRLQNKSLSERSDQENAYMDVLAKDLQAILTAMRNEARLGK
jgi:hypothetical protein